MYDHDGCLHYVRHYCANLRVGGLYCI